MLNAIWVAFFLVSFAAAAVSGDPGAWTRLVSAAFDSAKTAFTICLNLTGILCLWLGFLKIAEKSGITGRVAKMLAPLFRRIMPEVPPDHPAIGSMVMNMAANMLGLDNAATPAGLKAMEQLQDLNPREGSATNAQIMFMVINSSSVTLLPITILMYMAELGASSPSAAFVPILLATSVSTLAGFLAVAAVQRINVFDATVMAYLAAGVAAVAAITFGFLRLEPPQRIVWSQSAADFALYFCITCFIVCGMIKRLNLYDTFIEGAKEGFGMAVRIIPYLVAMLVAIAVFRASGVLDLAVDGIGRLVALCGLPTGFVPALPTALIKPLSGGGARAMMIETANTYGPDSFPAFASAVVQGSTETTFYVLAVYCGAVRLSKTRHAVPCALLADLAGITAAIVFAYMFYGG